MDDNEVNFEIKTSEVISSFIDINIPIPQRIHPGGIQHPEGYKLILQIPVDDGSISIQLDNLRPSHILYIRSEGISICLDRPKCESPYGRLHGRIIHDFVGTMLVFRKDEGNCTSFIVEFAHQ